jgi:hypothetical protein
LRCDQGREPEALRLRDRAEALYRRAGEDEERLRRTLSNR